MKKNNLFKNLKTTWKYMTGSKLYLYNIQGKHRAKDDKKEMLKIVQAVKLSFR